MESDLGHQHHFHDGHSQNQNQSHHHHQKQINSGLMRYQSAPSSYFSSFLDRDFGEDFINRPSSPEAQRIFSRIVTKNSDVNTSSSHQNVINLKRDSAPTSQVNQLEQIVDNSRCHQHPHHKNYTSASASASASAPTPTPAPAPAPAHNLYPIQLPDQNSSAGMKNRGTNNSNILRHSSSPAGFFSNMNIEFENGYAVLREAPFSATSGRMSTIAEVGNKSMGDNSLDTNDYGDAHGNNCGTSFSFGAWEGAADDNNTLSGFLDSELQNLETANPPPMLAHHLSLPKSSAIEKFLQFQDSVPCKARAKRGFATHPRSIAERVRRTKISERMRKLQDLVPNMDKQTSTADMLDLAVDYIKDLETQVKALSENCQNCACRNKQ